MESIEECIIVLVRQNEVLFNATTKSYRNAGLRDKCWRSIAEAVNMPADFVKNKWHRLRERYMKERREMKEEKRNGSAASSKPQWKFMELMQFIEPYVKPRKTLGNMSCVKQSSEFMDNSLSTVGYNDVTYPEDPYSPNPSGSINSIADNDSGSPSSLVWERPDPFEIWPEGINRLILKTLQDEKMDEDDYFLKSLTGPLKALPADKKLQAKIEILTIFKKLQ